VTPRHPIAPVIRVTALVFLGVGALIMIAAVFADPLGLGGGGEGFGWKQLILAIIGLVILLIGLAWLLRPPATSGYQGNDQLED
jgi:predicted MFS family arabinose efflux permease